ncbi:MAG: hypothetical protein QQN41_06970 [Nitrosopumilus sp.]
MPEQTESTPPSISPTLEKHQRNWKKILLILLILGISVSLVGVGIYFYGSGAKSLPSKKVQTKKTPETPKEHPLKNKIIYTKSIITDQKYTTDTGIERNSIDTDIYAMNLDGTGETKIYDVELNSTVPKAALSPNHNYLAWIKDGLEDQLKLLLINSNKKELVKTIGPFGEIIRYRFSPDETKIALVIDSNFQNKNDSLKLLIFDVQTTKKLYEFDNKTTDSIFVSLDWLDNNSVISSAKNEKGGYIASYSLNSKLELKGIIIPTIENIGGFRLELNDSRDKIAFSKFVVSDEDYYKSQIWISNTDGSNTEKISQFGFWYINSLAFSPDDKWIGVTSHNAEATFFHLANIESGKIIENTNPYFGIHWLLDGKKFVTVNGVYSNQLVIVGLDGKIEKELTSLSSQKVGEVSSYGLIGVIQ